MSESEKLTQTDDNFCEELYQDYMNSSDKNESYSLEDLIKNNPDCSEFMSPEEAMKELGLN